MNTNARTGKSLKIFLWFSILALSSCVRVVTVHTPAPLFMSAGSTGKSLAGSLILTQQSGTEGTLLLASDEIENPMLLRRDVSPLGAGLDLGIVEKLDFFYRGALFTESPGVSGLKFQLLGAPRAGSSRTAQDDELFDDDNQADFKSEAAQYLYEGSALYSYRTSDDIVAYSALRLSQHILKVKIDSSSDPGLDGKKLDYQSTNIGASLGITRYFKRTQATLEASAQQTNWTNNDPTTFAFVSASLGWHWP
ncbi:MAG: hypothetical protein WEB87_00200 [Bacteriovoracaceae bacterium]